MKKKLTRTIAALAALAVIVAIGIFSINQKITEGGGVLKTGAPFSAPRNLRPSLD